MAKRSFWTEDEIGLLRTSYPMASKGELLQAFPERSHDAIRHKASRLGITANIESHFRHLIHWSPQELEALRMRYPDGRIELLAQKLKKTPWAVYRKATDLGLRVVDFRKKPIRDGIFDGWTEFAAYWAGFIAADGCLQGDSKITIQLANRDSEHLQKFRDIIAPTTSLYRWRNSVILAFHSKRIFQRLLDMNITPRKSLTLKFPDTLPDEFIHHFIRGYSDGDGSIYKTRNLVAWQLLGTEAFLKRAINYLPYHPKVRKRHDCNVWIITVYGRPALEILEWLYQKTTICLERKRNRIF